LALLYLIQSSDEVVACTTRRALRVYGPVTRGICTGLYVDVNSTAKWEGDALVVDSIGFRDGAWIDWNGSEITELAKVRERITRPNYGHLQVEVT
jgi:hypothetical protein